MKNKLDSRLVFLWILLFGLLPFALVLVASFLTPDEDHFVKLPITLNNYINLLDPMFVKVFWRSFIVAIITTICCLLFAYPFSYFLIKSKHQQALLLLIIIPFWTSSLVRTYALLAMLKMHGIINTILLKLHIISQPLTLLYNNFAVISGLVYSLFPFMVLPIYSNMERFDFRLLEAARDLGASKLNIFFRVFLPSTKQGIVSGSILVMLPAMTLFYIPNILGGARSFMIGNLIQSQFLEDGNWPQGSATSISLMALLGIFLLSFKVIKRETK